MSQAPIGIRLCLGGERSGGSLAAHRALILVLTFFAYATYHLSRRPISIVKNVLHPNCTNATNPFDCGWDPFNTNDGDTLLSVIDSAFLFAYAFGMFVSGFIAERCNLRYFLALGMLFSGLTTYAVGLAFYWKIHSLWFFFFAQILCGVLQTTGWPAVVTCIGHWFNKSSRGTLFGIWNSHTNIGNILGALIAGAFVDYNWGLSFMIPGFIIGMMGFIIFLFLVPYPEDVGISSEEIHGQTEIINNDESQISSTAFQSSQDSGVFARDSGANFRNQIQSSVEDIETNGDEDSPLLQTDDSAINIRPSGKKAISFMQALKIPGVIEFSICLFFAKLVSYTFLFWLPFYIKASMHGSSSNSAFLSASFDLGGMIGAVLAGFLLDRYGSSAITCVVMLGFALPSLLCYYKFGALSNLNNIVLQIITGTFVNGPYSLITTSVSTELGTKVRSRQALATVTAIIDGIGSLGAAIGPLLCGPLAQTGWNNVFIMLILSDALAMLSLVRIAKQEYRRLRNSD